MKSLFELSHKILDYYPSYKVKTELKGNTQQRYRDKYIEINKVVKSEAIEVILYQPLVNLLNNKNDNKVSILKLNDEGEIIYIDKELVNLYQIYIEYLLNKEVSNPLNDEKIQNKIKDLASNTLKIYSL